MVSLTSSLPPSVVRDQRPVQNVERPPVARQIRDYYNTLSTDYIMLQRHEALLKVQQALEPITATIISTCSG